MHPTIWLAYGLAAAAAGAALAWWICWSRFLGDTVALRRSEASHTAEVLGRICDLATRVALDVDEHSSQVEKLNSELTASAVCESTLIVDIVAKLISANRHMQERLASTENKLREQAQQIQFYATEACTDALTLLANRRMFDEELARRIAEFERQGRVFSLIMADVDRFKKFNDTHGHQTGDDVLRGVARLLRRTMREMDLVARFGGEEFAIILPGAGLHEASRAAQRARKAIEQGRFLHQENELHVTASLGVAAVRSRDDGTTVLERLDKALYAAKDGGRNCVYRHDGQNLVRVAGDEERALPESTGSPPRKTAPRGSGEADPDDCVPVAGSVEPKPDAPAAALHDGSQGLATRTTFCQSLRTSMNEWNRGGPAFSVMLIAVNQRKRWEERCSQRTREAAMSAVTRFLTTLVRESGQLGSYASGCFALLLPTAGLADAIQAASRIHRQFAEGDSPVPASEPNVALSIGVVQVTDDDDSISLLERAESALEAADGEPGNRVYYHDGAHCVPLAALLAAAGQLP